VEEFADATPKIGLMRGRFLFGASSSVSWWEARRRLPNGEFLRPDMRRDCCGGIDNVIGVSTAEQDQTKGNLAGQVHVCVAVNKAGTMSSTVLTTRLCLCKRPCQLIVFVPLDTGFLVVEIQNNKTTRLPRPFIGIQDKRRRTLASVQPTLAFRH
jgi:hypothetical protein